MESLSIIIMGSTNPWSAMVSKGRGGAAEVMATTKARQLNTMANFILLGSRGTDGRMVTVASFIVPCGARKISERALGFPQAVPRRGEAQAARVVMVRGKPRSCGGWLLPLVAWPGVGWEGRRGGQRSLHHLMA